MLCHVPNHFFRYIFVWNLRKRLGRHSNNLITDFLRNKLSRYFVDNRSSIWKSGLCRLKAEFRCKAVLRNAVKAPRAMWYHCAAHLICKKVMRYVFQGSFALPSGNQAKIIVFDPIILLLVAINDIIPMLRSKTTDMRTYQRYVYCRIANRSKNLKKLSTTKQALWQTLKEYLPVKKENQQLELRNYKMKNLTRKGKHIERRKLSMHKYSTEDEIHVILSSVPTISS